MPRYGFFVLLFLFTSLLQADPLPDVSKVWFKPALKESHSPVCNTVLKTVQEAFLSGGALYDLAIPSLITPPAAERFANGNAVYFDTYLFLGCGGSCATSRVIASPDPIGGLGMQASLAQHSPTAGGGMRLFKYRDGEFYLLTAEVSADPGRMLVHRLERDYSWRPVCEIATAPQESQYMSEPGLQVPRQALAVFEKTVNEIQGGSDHCGNTHGRVTRSLHRYLLESLYRPWAAERESALYERVEVNLKKWSLTGVGEYQAFGRYKDQLARTEKVLAAHYRAQYGWPAEQARKRARIMLARALSTGFSFDQDAFSEENESLREAILERRPVDALNHIPAGSVDLNIAIINPDILGQQLLKGANPNQTNGFGKTPLMYAAQYNQLRSAELLLEYGADPNAATTYPGDSCEYKLTTVDMTALHYAARYASPELIALLVKHGAQPAANARRNYPSAPVAETALDWLRRYTAPDAVERNVHIPGKRVDEAERMLVLPSAEQLAETTRALVAEARKAYDDRKFHEAYRRLVTATRIDPTDAEALSHLAAAALQLGLIDEALEAIRRVRLVSSDPTILSDALRQEREACKAASAQDHFIRYRMLHCR